jgi:hypothetical protein
MKFTEQEHVTIEKCFHRWGEDAQKAMAVGEIGEYLTLVGRESQERATIEEWREETADVIIMMEEMARLRGYEEVKAIVRRKMAALEVKVSREFSFELTNFKSTPVDL